MNKTALVTGAAARVGAAISMELAQAGYAVAVHYNRSSSGAENVAREINAAGGTAMAIGADLTDSASTRTLIQRTCEQLGPLGLLVNNASIFEEDSLESPDDELWDRHFAIHVKAPTLLAADFAAQIGENEDGLIVNMIDERVWKLTPNFMSYTLSKSTLWTATRTMAQRLAPNIRVNAIGPGPTLPSSRQTQAQFDAQVDTLLLKRSPELEAFARTILYFAATPSVTGQMIALDGGQHLAWDTADQRGPE